MRILVLSNVPWNLNNSFGNTFTNIFSGIESVEIANIYCRYGSSDLSVVKKSFQITEKELLKNFLDKSISAGHKVNEAEVVDLSQNEKAFFDGARKRRNMLFFWARDFIWEIGRWKSKALKEFIDEFKPDLIFQPIYYSNYLSDIALFLKKHTGVPMVGYVSDDVYTLRQFSLSPLYWIDRLYKRRKVKKVVDRCEILYVISDIQKKEYDKCFAKNCKILWKGDKFENMPEQKQAGEIIKFVYTGNIGTGRYKQLANIGRVLEQINQSGKKAELDIYTLTPMTVKMKKTLYIPESVNIKGGISAKQVIQIQKDADVLVHVESFDLKSRLAVRQSFSTKIIDYLSQAKCVFAVGPKDVASIDYLIKNDAAITAVNEDEIKNKIISIIEKPQIINDYGQKAWECGRKNHQIDDIQKRLYKDFEGVLNENSAD